MSTKSFLLLSMEIDWKNLLVYGTIIINQKLNSLICYFSHLLRDSYFHVSFEDN